MRRTNVNNYKDILKSKNTIFIITLIAGIGLLTGLVLHQEKIQAERGNIALIKQQQNQQDVEQVKNAIKDFNIDSETIIDDWKKIQELKPTTDEGKKTLADFITKVANHYSEKALKLDIKDSDSQFQDKQALETAITSLQKILGIIETINSANQQISIEEKIRPIQELISKFQKQVEDLTKKEEEKTTQTETTTRDAGLETSRSEDSSYIQSYPETNGSISNSQAPATDQYSTDSASSGGDNGTNTGGQTADSSGSQAESNSHSD